MKIKLILLSAVIALNAAVLTGCSGDNVSDDDEQASPDTSTTTSSIETSADTEQEQTETTDETDTPQWTETPVSGTRYVNTNFIQSRIYAVQDSQKVKEYYVNDAVTVVAITDTDYYKLEDGTFIHSDYLSENEVEVITEGPGADYASVTDNGFVIERIKGITYVDGIMIANKTFTLPAEYDPEVQQEAADALAKMQAEAWDDGFSLYEVSGYRSYDTQKYVYENWVAQLGSDLADTISSRPGHSDHQTGYGFDMNTADLSFADTEEGKWLAEHCAEYGFIIRYPEGKEEYTGYMYDPCYIRWVGAQRAKAITESGLSLEEYYGIPSSYDISEDVFMPQE